SESAWAPGADACRAGEHPPVGTPPRPKPAHSPSSRVATIHQRSVGRGGPPTYFVQPSSFRLWPCLMAYRGALRLLARARVLVSHEYRREIETRVSPRTTWCSRGLLAGVATPVAIFVGPGSIAVTVGAPVAGPVSPAWTTAAAGSLITSCCASSARAPFTHSRVSRAALRARA